MVTSCSAPGCPSTLDCYHLQFEQFPLKKPQLLKKWLSAMNMTGYDPSKRSVLCSLHFNPNDYLFRPKPFPLKLKHNAVPVMFNNTTSDNLLHETEISETTIKGSSTVEKNEVTEDQETEHPNTMGIVYVEIIIGGNWEVKNCALTKQHAQFVIPIPIKRQFV